MCDSVCVPSHVLTMLASLALTALGTLMRGDIYINVPVIRRGNSED